MGHTFDTCIMLTVIDQVCTKKLAHASPTTCFVAELYNFPEFLPLFRLLFCQLAMLRFRFRVRMLGPAVSPSLSELEGSVSLSISVEPVSVVSVSSIAVSSAIASERTRAIAKPRRIRPSIDHVFTKWTDLIGQYAG